MKNSIPSLDNFVSHDQTLNIIPLDKTWQTVSGTDNKFQVYSAYVDVRKKDDPVIRMIVSSFKDGDPQGISCRFYYGNNEQGWKGKGKLNS